MGRGGVSGERRGEWGEERRVKADTCVCVTDAGCEQCD